MQEGGASGTSKMRIDISDSESEGDGSLLHAKTLRLDDCGDQGSQPAALPAARGDGKAGNADEGRHGKAESEADMWKRRYEEMAAMIAKLQEQQQQPSSPSISTPTPKGLFSADSLSDSALLDKASDPAKKVSPLQSPNPETPKAPALPSVPKQPQVPSLDLAKSGLAASSKAAPAKACPTQEDSDQPDDTTTLREGEEALAELLDLSHEEGS